MNDIIKRTIAALTGYKTALSVLGDAKGPVEAWVTSDCDDMGDAEVLEDIEAAIKEPPDVDALIVDLEAMDKEAMRDRDEARRERDEALVKAEQLERTTANSTARHIIAVCEGNGGVEVLGNSNVETAIKRMVLRDAEQMRKLERERDEARARVNDLLVSNNTYLENARRSRRELLREKLKCRALAERLIDRQGEAEG